MDQTLEELVNQKTPVLYRAGHVSIRQLAEKLRSAMKDASKGGKETKSVQYAYGLPFVKTLKLWVHAVAKCEPLKTLVEPLTIVILSAIRAKESHLIYTPYVTILIGLVNELALARGVFIPVASSCLATIALCANKLSSKTLTAEGREPNITDVVRVSERQLKDRRVVRGLLVNLVHELTNHLAFLSRTGALPEVGWIILQNLRKLAKANIHVKQDLSPVISALEESIKEVKEKRKMTDSLIQFGFEETALGRLMMKQKSSPVKKTEVVEEDDEKSESESESEDESERATKKPKVVQEERSKRSLKRERQKEKKRLQRLNNASDGDKMIAQVQEEMAQIDDEEMVVPFDFSSSEDE
jgi:hypothetical protein